jgi:hypothetical protein
LLHAVLHGKGMHMPQPLSTRAAPAAVAVTAVM